MCILRWFFRRRCRRPRIVSVRLAGLSYINSDGRIILATVTVDIGKTYFASLVFVNDVGATGIGPVGSVSSSDPAIVPGLSADGQTLNLAVIGQVADSTVGADITWTDPTGKIAPTVLVNITDVAVTPPPFEATGVALGPLTEGPAVA